MTKKIDDENRVRKVYAEKGSRSQERFTFRMDIDNYEVVQQQPNKGRFVNDAIREKIQRNGSQ